MDFEVIKRGNVIEMLESPTSEVSALDLGGRVVTALMRHDEVQNGLKEVPQSQSGQSDAIWPVSTGASMCTGSLLLCVSNARTVYPLIVLVRYRG